MEDSKKPDLTNSLSSADTDAEAEGSAPSAEVLPKKLKKASQSLTASLQFHQGPLPPPEMLNRYDQILPGAADRILRMAERQAEHRQKLESEKAQLAMIQQKDKTGLAKTGLWFAFLFALGLLTGAVYLYFINQPWGGGFLTGIFAGVGWFIYGSQGRNSPDIQGKTKKLDQEIAPDPPLPNNEEEPR